MYPVFIYTVLSQFKLLWCSSEPMSFFSLVTLYNSFFLSLIRMAFVEGFQLASVNIGTILCIVSVFPRPFSAGQPV